MILSLVAAKDYDEGDYVRLQVRGSGPGGSCQ